MRKFVKWLVLTPLFVVALAYGINAFIVTMSSPYNVKAGEVDTQVQEIGDLRVLAYDDLTSGGLSILGWHVHSSGYVNMLAEDSTIYISSDHVEGFQQNAYLYKHEFAHVLQKKMVAEETGGYPSVSNPWRSFVYYYNLYRLNSALRDVMPEVVDNDEDTNSWFMTDGFEAAAECYAQPASPSPGETPGYYNAGYLVDGYCSAVQKRLAITLITSDEWFDGELTDEEMDQIKPVNLTNDRCEAGLCPALDKKVLSMERYGSV